MFVLYKKEKAPLPRWERRLLGGGSVLSCLPPVDVGSVQRQVLGVGQRPCGQVCGAGGRSGHRGVQHHRAGVGDAPVDLEVGAAELQRARAQVSVEVQVLAGHEVRAAGEGHARGHDVVHRQRLQQGVARVVVGVRAAEVVRAFDIGEGVVGAEHGGCHCQPVQAQCTVLRGVVEGTVH